MAPPQSGLASLPSSNSPDHNAKGTQSGAHASEDTRHPPTACKHVVSGSLSLPAQGCFSPVPHGTRSLSVTQESLALEGGPPSFTPDYSCRALLRNSTTTSAGCRVPGSHRLWRPVPGDFRYLRSVASVGPTTPQRPKAPRFGLFPFRSPLLRESRLISLPPGTEMFQFPGFASRLTRDDGLAHRRVSPFGHPRINACVPLPLAYRSLPRPSSPPCAQASPTCFRSLDHKSSEVRVKQSTRDLRHTSETARAACTRVVRLASETPRLPAPLPFLVSIRIPRSLLPYRCQTAMQSPPFDN